mgnify:CR=1 FL=1
MTSPIHQGPRDADQDGRDDIIISVRGLDNSIGEQIIHDDLDLDVITLCSQPGDHRHHLRAHQSGHAR